MSEKTKELEKTIFRLKLSITLFSLITAFCFMSAVAISLAPSAIATDGKTKLPVLMYHLVIDDASRVSEFVITPDMLRADLQYISDNGYTTVVMQDIIDHVQSGAPLPEKPVMITFDDGYYNNYLHAYPLLEEFDMRAVISVIGTEADEYTASGETSQYYSHCTWTQLAEMSDSGVIELQNHSYDMHHIAEDAMGIGRRTDEELSAYQSRLYDDLSKMQQRFIDELGITPTTFTYPFGASNEDARAVIADLGFSASLGTSGMTYYVSHDPDCLQLIPRYNRSDKISAKDILSIA